MECATHICLDGCVSAVDPWLLWLSSWMFTCVAPLGRICSIFTVKFDGTKFVFFFSLPFSIEFHTFIHIQRFYYPYYLIRQRHLTVCIWCSMWERDYISKFTTKEVLMNPKVCVSALKNGATNSTQCISPNLFLFFFFMKEYLCEWKWYCHKMNATMCLFWQFNKQSRNNLKRDKKRQKIAAWLKVCCFSSNASLAFHRFTWIFFFFESFSSSSTFGHGEYLIIYRNSRPKCNYSKRWIQWSCTKIENFCF